MIPKIKPHPRTCYMCEENAENPHVAMWNHHFNEKVSLCTRECFVKYASMVKSIPFYDKGKVFQRRKSI